MLPEGSHTLQGGEAGASSLPGLLVTTWSHSFCPQLQQHKDEDLSSLAQVSDPVCPAWEGCGTGTA